MNRPNNVGKIISFAMTILLIGMSASSLVLSTDRQLLDDENDRYYTSGSTNAPGFTSGSIYTDATIASGRGTVCMVMQDQSLKCWGANNQGQLGNGEAGNGTHSTVPVTVSEAANMSFREVAVGYYNACAVTTSDEVYCWGSGRMGQLGRNTCEVNPDGGNWWNGLCINHGDKSPQKVQFPGNSTVKTMVSGEGGHSCAILENGSVSCWGHNHRGQLGYAFDIGENFTFCRYVNDFEVDAPDHQCNRFSGVGAPNLVKFPDDRPAVSVSVGGSHSCAVLDNNSVYCWGESGKMGKEPGYYVTSTADIFSSQDTQLILTDSTSFSSSGGNGLLRHADGEGNLVWQGEFVWTGKVGDTLTGVAWAYSGPTSSVPAGSTVFSGTQFEPVHVPMPEGRGALAVEGGGIFTVAILDNGSLAYWGQGGSWNPGDPNNNGMQPVINEEVPQGRTALSFAQASSFGCAILDGNEAYCGGQNTNGQLGNGGASAAVSPLTKVSGEHDFVALTTMGQWFSANWDQNSSGEWGSTESTCAITVDSKVYCWGANTRGQLGSYYPGEGGTADPYPNSNEPDPIQSYTTNLASLSDRDPDSDGILSMSDPLPMGCPAGHYAVGDPVECSGATAAGYYSPEYSEEQFPCPTGYYQPLAEQASCIPADPGNFVTGEASTEQTPCSPGTYQPASLSTDCITASSGHYVASSGATNQDPCLAGSWQSSPGQTSCFTASSGHFVESSGSDAQDKCQQGQFQPSEGATSCLNAEPGHYVDIIGSAQQIPCPVGKYMPGTGASECTQASAGNYVDSEGASSQSLCPAGTYQPQKAQASCIESSPGNYTNFDGATSQVECPAGTFQASPGQTSCENSQPGNYSAPGSSSPTLCPSGTYSEFEGQSQCTPADPGSYVDFDGATGQIPCPEGQYQSESGSGSCIEPALGEVASPDGTSTLSCTPGNYRPEGQTSCIPASPGHYVSEEGASSQTPCEPGTYRSTAGKTSCMDATPGSYVPEEGASDQIPCPKGEYQNLGGQDSCQEAMPGHSVPEEGAMSQTSCRPGSFQPDQGQESCLEANPGNFVQSSGATSQTPCEPGTFQASEGSRSCDLAQPGNFVAEEGATEQTQCPSGQEQEYSGQTECNDVERPLLLTLLIFAVPSVVLGTMAVLYISGRKKEGGGRGKAYMYSEDLTVGQIRKKD